MKPTAKEAKEAKESSGTNYCLSLEECLECFDERLLQCQEYTRRKVKQEINSKGTNSLTLSITIGAFSSPNRLFFKDKHAQRFILH